MKEAGADEVNPEERARFQAGLDSMLKNPKMKASLDKHGPVTVVMLKRKLNASNEEEANDPPLASYQPGTNMVVLYDLTGSPWHDTPETTTPARVGVATTYMWAGYEGILRHEYGHHVHRHTNDYALTALTPWKQLWERYVSEAPHFTADLDDRRDISYYSQENFEEGWAEAFTVVTAPDYDPDLWEGVTAEALEYVEEHSK